MKRHLWLFLGPIVAAGILLVWTTAAQSQVLPGWSVKMPCAYCHNVHGTGQLVTRGEANIEALCQSCHGTGWTDPNDATKVAVPVKVHQLLSGKATYGAYKISCIGCHNPHKYLANNDTAARNPNGYGNIFLIGQEPSVSGPISKTSGIPFDGIARLARPFINNNGTPTNFGDDTMQGYYCGVNTVSGQPNPCSETNPPSASDSVRKIVFWKDTVVVANLATDPWENQWAQALKSGSNWLDIPAPTVVVARWYNGACNVCHSRTGHHRRDNSGGDRRHNLDNASGCKACHNHNANKGGWLR